MTDFAEKNPVLKEDFEYIKSNFDWAPFSGKTLLITGAGGFLGSLIAKSVLFSTKDTKILALVRNEEKACRIFKNFHSERLKFIIQDVCEPPKTGEKADFIIHAAAETSSEKFFNNPVQTIETALTGTQNLLKYAVKSGSEGFVYVSSLEIYGAHTDDEKICENSFCALDTMNPRSSYPESKRMCENLCAAYAKEYGLRAMSARLTQTFGAGMDFHDSRVIMQFLRSVMEKKNIVLHTDGASKKKYCYAADAVLAILTILTKGEPSKAYNIAGDGTYFSIKELAQKLIAKYPETKLIFKKNVSEKYFPACSMNLDTQKLKNLGWKANFSIDEMIERTIRYFEGENER